jgi:hypothetical protein
MAWYHRFDYKANPFERDPFKTNYTFINHVNFLQDLLYLVKSGSIFAIQAPEGGGKTMMLRQIVENFKGKTKIAYVDARKIGEELDIEEIIDKKGSPIIGTLFKRKPKQMILLLDNVESLSSKNCEKIKYYFDQNYLHSVVFATQNYDEFQISRSLRDRIMNQVFELPNINKFDALRIVRNRFQDAFFLGDEAIFKIYQQSNSNIKFTLRNCEKVCRFVVNEGRGEVLVKYINMILKKKTPITRRHSEQNQKQVVHA